jgi:hypothetical protein
MSILAQLAACAGQWQGTNRLYDPNHDDQPDDTPSTLSVTPILNGRFVRLDYTWRYQGQPQSGALIVGHEDQANVDTAYWVDTWHNGDKGMLCRGPARDGASSMTVAGTFAAPPGPDWGWDIVLTPRAGQSFEIVMHVYTPEGVQGPAVEARYSPETA